MERCRTYFIGAFRRVSSFDRRKAGQFVYSGRGRRLGHFVRWSACFLYGFAGGLIQSFGALTVTGWGMLVGGAGISFLFPPFRFDLSHIGAGEAAAILFVVLCGTALAFAYTSAAFLIFPQKKRAA